MKDGGANITTGKGRGPVPSEGTDRRAGGPQGHARSGSATGFSHTNSEGTSRKVGKGGRASYTPSAAVDPHSFGRSGGGASFANPPAVVIGGSSVAQDPGAVPAILRVGQDKNVSTPVSGS